MKLIYCTNCKDLFKITSREMRTCHCGKIRGHYLRDRKHAEISTGAISLVLGNPQFREAIDNMMKLFTESKGEAKKSCYKEEAKIALAYVRPNSGPGNPRTSILK